MRKNYKDYMKSTKHNIIEKMSHGEEAPRNHLIYYNLIENNSSLPFFQPINYFKDLSNYIYYLLKHYFTQI